MEGTETNEKIIENGSTNESGGGTGGTGDRSFPGHARLTAFGKQRPGGNQGSDGQSSGNHAASQSNGDPQPSGSNRHGEGSSGQVEQSDAASAESILSGRSVPDGSTGNSRDIERRAKRAEYKREQRRKQRDEREQQQRLTASSTESGRDSAEPESGNQGNFIITHETPADQQTPEQIKPGTTKRSPRAAGPSNKKYKEPPKEQVSLVAASFQDVYEIADSVLGIGLRLSGVEIPAGTFLLADNTSEKLARSLIQMNNSLPKLAERVNKVSAPAIFFSTLLTDLAMKGVIVYAAIQSKKQNPQLASNT